ncbi:hypothetical protein BC835DRAFT_1418063 [Cytidiella melzeri]|nr:hypothetical protein BC835DRAFT_1418063 [Cytidiella melzeri]
MSAATPTSTPNFSAQGSPGVPFATFNNLSVAAVIFASLSALFGVYMVLFVLAIWSTYRRSGSPYKGLRIVTSILFVTLLIHYIVHSVMFGQSRLVNPPTDLEWISTIPLTFIGAITTVFAGFLCDGLVAWRFYIVYGRKRWAFYAPIAAVTINLLFGLSGTFQIFAFYHSTWEYDHTFQLTTFRISAAWGWLTFSINTILSGAIIAKIIHVSRYAIRNDAVAPYGESRCNTALAAITESALVTWIGLLLYEVASLAPTGHITDASTVGYVIIIPVFFVGLVDDFWIATSVDVFMDGQGISQCLITVRLGFANDSFDQENKKILGLSMSNKGNSRLKEISITVTHEATSDRESEKAHSDVVDISGEV